MAPCLLSFPYMLGLLLPVFLITSAFATSSYAEMWSGDGPCETILTTEPPKLVLPPLSLSSLFEKNLAGQLEYNLEDASIALSQEDRERIVRTLLLDRVGFFGRFGVSVVQMADKPFGIPHLISDAQKLQHSNRTEAKDFHIQFGKISLALFYSAFAYEYRASGKINLNVLDLGLTDSAPLYLNNTSTEMEHRDAQNFLKWMNEQPARATYAGHVFGEALNVLINPTVYRSYMLASDNYKRESFNPVIWHQILSSPFVMGAARLNPFSIIRRKQLERLRRETVDRLMGPVSSDRQVTSSSNTYMPQAHLLSVEQAPYLIGSSFAVDFMTVLDLKDFKAYKNKTLAAVEIAQTYSDTMVAQSANLVELASQANLSPKRLYTLRTILDAMTDDAKEMAPILRKTLSVLSAAKEAAANGSALKAEEADAYKELEAQLSAKVEKAKSIEQNIEATRANLEKANKKLNN